MNLKMSLLAIPFIFSVTALAQKAKIKQKNTVYNYTVYPELEGFENLKTYSVKIKDNNNVNYSYSEGTTNASKNVDVHNPLGIAYGFKWLNSDTDFVFDITLTSSEENPPEVQVHQDPGTKRKKYVYKFSAKQSYNVKIYSGTELIKEFALTDLAAISFWPGTPSGSVGYNSEKLLASNYQKKEAEVEGFIKQQKSALMLPLLKSVIGKEIIRVLHESREKFIYVVSMVKTKDDRFDRLDSAIIYLDQGFDIVKANEKSGKKGNHHVANAQSLFSKAHAIYTEYSKDEYIEWFTDKELQEEYIFAMATNLYLTSFLTSDFESADKLHEATAMKAQTDESIPAEQSISGQFGSLKRSPAVKARDRIGEIRYYQKREERLKDVFQKRMGY